MNRAELKARAKSQLGGIFEQNWLYAVLFVFIASALTGAASVVPVLGSLIVFGPMTYAISKMLIKLSRTGEKPDLNDLFDGFKDDFAGTFLIGFLTTIFVALWSMLFIIPGIVKSYAYSFAFYIKADHPDYEWRQCIEESKRLTQGHKGELFILDLSFIGWVIVGSFCLGVGMLWVDPYMGLTKVHFYNDLVANDLGSADYNQPEDETFSEFEQ